MACKFIFCLLQINNFSSSFSDGRMFCYLIHHYQPGLLPLDLITNETSLSQRLMAEPPPPSVLVPVQEDFTSGWAASFSPSKYTHYYNDTLDV